MISCSSHLLKHSVIHDRLLRKNFARGLTIDSLAHLTINNAILARIKEQDYVLHFILDRNIERFSCLFRGKHVCISTSI